MASLGGSAPGVVDGILAYDTYMVLKFGAYVQTHEEHTNDMTQKPLEAICLGPTHNHQEVPGLCPSPQGHASLDTDGHHC